MDGWIITACRVPYPPIPPSTAQVQVLRAVGVGGFWVGIWLHIWLTCRIGGRLGGHSQVQGGIRVRGCMKESGPALVQPK